MGSMTRRDFIHRAGIGAGSAMLYPALARSRTQAQSADEELAFKSATELTAMLRNRDVSSVELTQYFIDRIEEHNEKLNAIVVRDFDRALEAARAADEALSRGSVLGPLHGLPMTIKESYDIAGLPTTWGVPAAAGNIASADAVVVSRYKDAGAHFMGKTNVPLLLSDFQSYNEIYGTTNNPWNLERTPGGSSGGTAVALATGMTGLDSGSDIGGSIRNPAHFCGVYGHKPTLGVVPARGHTPPGVPAVPQDPDLAVVGPLARSAEDLALAMDIIAGPDVLDESGWRLELPAPRMSALGELRVALWPDDSAAPVDGEISDRVAAVGERLARLGATVSDSARPAGLDSTEYQETYQSLLYAVVGGPVGNVDHQTWLRLHGRRGGYRMGWQAFFRDWDVVLCPVMATDAFQHDHSPLQSRTLSVDGEPRDYFEQIFWAGLATLSYLPATVFPTGLSSSGLPIGLQVIGAAFDDRTTIEFARLMAQEMGGFVPPPGYGAS